MPETAIHEHGQPVLGENEIGTDAKDRACYSMRVGGGAPNSGSACADLEIGAPNHDLPPPAGDTLLSENPDQRQLRILVPARADARHHLAEPGRGENVGHEILLTMVAHGFSSNLEGDGDGSCRALGPVRTLAVGIEQFPGAVPPLLIRRTAQGLFETLGSNLD